MKMHKKLKGSVIETTNLTCDTEKMCASYSKGLKRKKKA